MFPSKRQQFILFTHILASFLLQVCSIQREVVLIKIGGSSITNKGSKEELNPRALAWFAKTLVQGKSDSSFVIVHGAGSFGHFTAKEYGLKGRDGPPSDGVDQGLSDICSTDDSDDVGKDTMTGSAKSGSNGREVTKGSRQYMLEGLSATRLSVQKLNNHVVAALIDQGLPAIGISPCFGIPEVQAHGGTGAEHLQNAVYSALKAGLVPVLHGDACLWGDQDVGILSGDVVMEILGVSSWVSRAIFLTDVDGVYTSDPKQTPDAKLIPILTVNTDTGLLVNPTVVNAQESGYDHDVTGGLKTKLKSAIRIAATGKTVTVARCETPTAESLIVSGTSAASATYTMLRPAR